MNQISVDCWVGQQLFLGWDYTCNYDYLLSLFKNQNGVV